MDEYAQFEQEQADKYGNNGGDYYGSNRRGDRGGRGGQRNDNYDSGYGDRGSRGSRGTRGSRGRGGRGGGNDDSYNSDRGSDRFGNDRGGGGGQGTVRLSDFVNAENRFRAIKMRGLPFSANVREIRDFFEDFRVAERDITIDMN